MQFVRFLSKPESFNKDMPHHSINLNEFQATASMLQTDRPINASLPTMNSSSNPKFDDLNDLVRQSGISDD